MGKTITFYETADGKAPVRRFLDAMPDKAAQKVAYVLMLIEEVAGGELQERLPAEASEP